MEKTTDPAVAETKPAEFSPRKFIDRKTASVLLLFVAQVGIGIMMMAYRGCNPQEQPAPTSKVYNSTNNHEVNKMIFVHVIGQVRVPGVYKLPQGSKTFDAIASAGGSLPTAKLDGVNLTRTLSDEEQVVIP